MAGRAGAAGIACIGGAAGRPSPRTSNVGRRVGAGGRERPARRERRLPEGLAGAARTARRAEARLPKPWAAAGPPRARRCRCGEGVGARRRRGSGRRGAAGRGGPRRGRMLAKGSEGRRPRRRAAPPARRGRCWRRGPGWRRGLGGGEALRGRVPAHRGRQERVRRGQRAAGGTLRCCKRPGDSRGGPSARRRLPAGAWGWGGRPGRGWRRVRRRRRAGPRRGPGAEKAGEAPAPRGRRTGPGPRELLRAAEGVRRRGPWSGKAAEGVGLLAGRRRGRALRRRERLGSARRRAAAARTRGRASPGGG
jgi:hypothetical protein